MQISTTIQAVLEKETKTGKQYHVIVTDAGKMSCWEGKIAGELMNLVGSIVSIEYEQTGDKGQYMNLKSYKAPTNEEKFGAGIDDRNRRYEDIKDERIMRQVALKTAAELVIGSKVSLEQMFQMADKINNYLLGKKEPNIEEIEL